MPTIKKVSQWLSNCRRGIEEVGKNMDYHKINTMIKALVEQMQNIVPQLELARGKEAIVMQEEQDSEIVEEASKEAFSKFLRIVGLAQKTACQLFDIFSHSLIEDTRNCLCSLDCSLSGVGYTNRETGKTFLLEGHIEGYLNTNKENLATLRRLSQELSKVSPAFLISQELRNVILEIRALGSRFAAHEYSKIDGFPGPYDMIRGKITGLLNDIKSTQEICIQVSEDATTALIKLYHRVSDVKSMVNRNFSKGETSKQKLKSIQDDLSQAFKKLEMDYRDLLEDLAVEFELNHLGLAEKSGTEQESAKLKTVHKALIKALSEILKAGNITEITRDALVRKTIYAVGSGTVNQAYIDLKTWGIITRNGQNFTLCFQDYKQNPPD